MATQRGVNRVNRSRVSPAKRRSLFFRIAACATITIAAAWLHSERIQPLAAPPNGPPPGFHLAWAGGPIRNFAESVDTYVTSCGKPVFVKVALYPAVGRPWKPPAPGSVAFAVSGEMPIQLHDIVISLSNKLGRPLRFLHGPTTLSALGIEQKRLINPDFMFRPEETRNIEVSFKADWLSQRVPGGSCWLNLPSLMGGNTAEVAANEVIGHSDWIETQRSSPLYSAANYLHYGQSDVRLDSSGSIPLPSELEEPSWGCVKDSEGGHNCEAFAALERPGSEASRTRLFSYWSILEGILLTFIATILYEIGHLVFGIKRHSPPPSSASD